MTDWAAGIEMRNYGIKREIDAGILSEHLKTIVMLGLVAGTLLFYSWVRSQIINTGYESQNLFTLEESLLRTQKWLILEEETLRNPERIDTIARAELSMAPLQPNQLILPPLPNESGSNYVMAMANSEAAGLKQVALASAAGMNNNN